MAEIKAMPLVSFGSLHKLTPEQWAERDKQVEAWELEQDAKIIHDNLYSCGHLPQFLIMWALISLSSLTPTGRQIQT